MTGLLYFLAASRQALMLEEEVQLTAAAFGIALVRVCIGIGGARINIEIIRYGTWL